VRVLVVEDDRTVGQFVLRGLEQQGMQVELAGDGREALERATAGEFDLIVLDLRLPLIPGIEVLRKLLARVEAVARRPKAIAPPTLAVADLAIDTGSREVRRAGRQLDVTPKEYAVLEYLARNRGRVMSRTLITEYAWGYHFDPGTNVVDVVINRLRKKVDQGFSRKLIHTVRGVGYVMKD
jgi:two-component system OmpR family response regulator